MDGRRYAPRVREIETDYLVVGAGASGMAFVDTLTTEADVDVVMVDRRHRPGGHWLDAYPFVRLHQPSANYGVNSRMLGNDRIDDSGINAGFYERATAPEICDYFNRVLEDHLVPSGKVRFLGMSDYQGSTPDGHHVASVLSGEEYTVKVRRKCVDATYVESSIPSRHTPAFEVDAGVRLIPPNDLVDLQEPATGYTVIGAGKTAMDTCNWLLDVGVPPERIRWIRPRDAWLFNRAFMQPRELVASYMQLQARWVEAAAEAATGNEFARRLAEHEVLIQIDEDVEPDVFRGATLSIGELEALRQIDNVVRMGKVLRIGTDRITLTGGEIATDPLQIHVDCTAAGVRPAPAVPMFAPGRITMQYVTLGIVPWSAATVGLVEATRDHDDVKNALCPPLVFTGSAADMLTLAYAGMRGLMARTIESDIAAWTEQSRLNPAGGANDHLDDPRVGESFASMGAHLGAAMQNLEQRTASAN
jgi:hypothetical protein